MQQTAAYAGIGPLNGKLVQVVFGAEFGDLVDVNITTTPTVGLPQDTTVQVGDVVHINYT